MNFPSIAETLGYIMLVVFVGAIIVAVIMNSPDKGEIFIAPDPSVPEKIEPDKQSRIGHDFELDPVKYSPGIWFHDGWKVRNYG